MQKHREIKRGQQELHGHTKKRTILNHLKNKRTCFDKKKSYIINECADYQNLESEILGLPTSQVFKT